MAMRASELPSCEVLGPLDPAFAKPRTVALLERAENRHLLDHVAMDAFGAHVFPGDLLAYPPAGFLQDLNRQIQDGNPIHLWVNLPVCEQRCHFCQFPVVTARDAGHRGGVLQRGLDAYLREVRLWLEAVPALGQVPIGAFSLLGGTPTLLSDEQLEALLYFYREHFRFRADTSIRIEGTASSFTRDRLEQLRHQGIGTVSAGIQSFDDAVLAAAHCVHTAADAIRYLEQARLRFEVDLDLMYGMAGQDVRGFTHHGRLKKAARIFRDSGYRIHLDLGYEIKSDKGRFFAPHEDGLPDWVHRIRTLPEPFGQYSNELVAGSLRRTGPGGGRGALCPGDRQPAGADVRGLEPQDPDRGERDPPRERLFFHGPAPGHRGLRQVDPGREVRAVAGPRPDVDQRTRQPEIRPTSLSKGPEAPGFALHHARRAQPGRP
jgi:hypothetical protein